MTVEGDGKLGLPEYWDAQYSQSNGQAPTHEWYRSFKDLRPFLERNMFTAENFKVDDNPLILHLGSGDSVIPTELAALGYKRQLCVDFSPVVVKLMTERHSQIESIDWRQMDVRDLSGLADGSIDVAFDKGTLDAMMHGSPWDPPAGVKEDTSRYLREVNRVLKNQGVFLYVTFKQPHFIKPLLKQNNLWEIEMQVLKDEGSFDYYGYVMQRK